MSVADWEVKEKEELYKWLNSLLKTSNVTLTFTKKDGSERVMNATLKEEIIPKYEKKTDREKTPSIETMSVFDIDKNEWRSFRLDSLKKIEGSL